MAEETTIGNLPAWPAPAPAPGPPPPPPPPLPPDVGRPRRRRGVIIGLAVAVCAAAGIVGVAGSGGHSEPPHPDAWDARVVDLVKFVEGEKRLAFEHPVFVDFLPESEFRSDLTTEAAELSEKDRWEIEQVTGMFRALGLIGRDVDLFGAVNKFQGEATLAYYEPATQRIRVKGTDLSVNVKATLVHELTHALQDQHFDLEREGSFPIDGQNDTFRPVFEGDASRVATQWLGTLNAADLAAYDEASQAEVDNTDLAGVPDSVVQFFAAPYNFGEPFVDILVSAQGRSAVDDALRDPPHADADLLDPFRFLKHEEPKAVAEPALAAGEKKVDDGTFGALGLYLVLAQHQDPVAALTAVDAWNGDAFVNYVKDGKGCVKADFAARDAGTSLLKSALDVWAAALPSGTAAITEHDGLVGLNSCDPGNATAVAPSRDLGLAVLLAVSRTQMAHGMMLSAGLTPAQARCSAHAFLASFSPAELPGLLTATSFEEIPEAAATRAGEAARLTCLVPD